MMQIYLVVSLLVFTSFSDAATALVNRTAVDIKVDKDAVVAVDLFMPINGEKTKALIILVPGSGGIGHYAFENLPVKNQNAVPQSFDFLKQEVVSFAKAGYATAIYSQRGIRRPSECAKGDFVKDILSSFALNCYDKKVRAKVDLETITSDTSKVFEYLSAHTPTKDLPQIALGYSEGSHHISKAIDIKKMNPKGIVFVGGMFDSLATTHARQFRKEFYFEKFELTFKATNKEQISFADVVTYANVNFWLGHPNYPPWGIGSAMGNIVINREDMLKRKQLFENSYQEILKRFSPQAAPQTMEAVGEKLVLPEFWSGQYYVQSLRSSKTIIDQLEQYRGEIRFLYGSADSLVKIPPITACDQVVPRCKIEIIEGVGHGLEEKSGPLPERSINAVLNAINAVAAVQK